jgi:hypothetical protein
VHGRRGGWSSGLPRGAVAGVSAQVGGLHR